MRLLQRPKPFVDEPFYSYALRLAKENDTTVNDVYRLCGLTFRKFHPNILFKEDIAKGDLFLSLGDEIINESNFMYQISREFSRIYTVEMLGLTLEYHHFNKGSVKVCPHCVSEKKYLNSIWQLVHMTLCPQHKCLLVDKCNVCNKALRWHAGILEECHCSATWDQLISSSQFIEAEEELILANLVESKLRNSKCEINQLYCTQLFELSYVDLTFLLSLIAWVLPSTKPFWSMNFIEQEDNGATHMLLVQAIETLSSWPLKFHSFLGLIEMGAKYRKTNIKSRKDDGKEKYLGLLSEFYMRLHSQTSLQFVKDEIEGYKRCSNDRRIQERRKIAFSTQEVSVILGIHEKAVVYFSKKQIIKAISGPGIDGYLSWGFDKGSVTTILDVFEKSIFRHSGISEKDVMNFRAAAISPMTGGYVPNMEKIIAKVLSGVLLPCDSDSKGKGLNKFIFRKVDLLQAFTEELFQFNDGSYTVKLAAKKLKLSQNRLKYFIKKRFVHTELTSNGCTVITSQELVRFGERYILSTEIINKVGVRRFEIIKWLKERGINPINEVIDDKNHQYLFLRDENLIKVLGECSQ